MRRRECAHPLLIGDILSAQEESDQGVEDHVRFITPSGARVLRALIGGVLMEKENIGTSENPIFRLRIADPTGGLSIMVGKFNPDLIGPVGALPCPTFVSVVGRLRTFTGKAGEKVITMNPEIITRLDRDGRQEIMLLAVRDVLSRLWMMTGRGQPPSKAVSVPMPAQPRGGEEVVERLHELINSSLEAIDRSFHARFLEASRTVHESSEHDPDRDPLEEHEDDVLEMIRNLDSGKGARWDAVIDYIEKKKLSRDLIEEVISSLLDKGMLYEPVLGYLKAI
jgi:RPA family protein